MKRVVLALLASTVYGYAAAEGASLQSPITIETLAQSTSSWDGAPYETYPSGQPQITVLKFTIAPHTVMICHSHPMPSAGYVLAGELTSRNGMRPRSTSSQDRWSRKRFTAFTAASQAVNRSC